MSIIFFFEKRFANKEGRYLLYDWQQQRRNLDVYENSLVR